VISIIAVLSISSAFRHIEHSGDSPRLAATIYSLSATWNTSLRGCSGILHGENGVGLQKQSHEASESLVSSVIDEPCDQLDRSPVLFERLRPFKSIWFV
jgi:hypothetical protein